MSTTITDENINEYIKNYLDSSIKSYFDNFYDDKMYLIHSEAMAMDNLSKEEKLSLVLDNAMASGLLDPNKQEYYNTVFAAEFLADWAPQLLSHFIMSDGDKEKKKVVKIIEGKYGRGYQITTSELRSLSSEEGFEYPKWLAKNRVKRGLYRVPVLLNEYDYNAIANMAGLPCGDLNEQLRGMSARVTQTFKSIKAHYSMFIQQAGAMLVNPFTLPTGIWQTLLAAAKDAVVTLWNALADLLDPKIFEKLMYMWAQMFIDAGLGMITALGDLIVSTINTTLDTLTAMLKVPGAIVSEIQSKIDELKNAKIGVSDFLMTQERLHKCSTKSTIFQQ